MGEGADIMLDGTKAGAFTFGTKAGALTFNDIAPNPGVTEESAALGALLSLGSISQLSGGACCDFDISRGYLGY